MDGPVVLVDAESDVERGLVTEWLRTHDVHPRERSSPSTRSALAKPLASLADDVPVTPVRVAWLPREREGSRRVRWSDVVSLDAVRRPPAGVQARIVRREPDRATVVAGEPATVGDLRRRYAPPGRARGLRGVRRPPGHPRARTGRARAARRPLQGAAADRRGHRGQPGVPPGGGRARRAARAAGGGGRPARRGRPGRARRVDEPDRRRPVHRRAAALPHAGRGTCRSTRPGWPGCGSATAPTRWCSCPATAATPIRCCSPTCSPSATSRATTCSAGTT